MPRASRSNAYYELLCNQQTNGYHSPCHARHNSRSARHHECKRVGQLSRDFATDAAQDVGVHGAAAELIMQETFLGTAAEDVGILGSYAVKGIKDVQDGTRTAEGGSAHRRRRAADGAWGFCCTRRLCRCTYRSALCRDFLDQCG